MKKLFLTILSIVMLSNVMEAQKLTFSGNFGYSDPRGNLVVFDDIDEDPFGSMFSADVMYHMPQQDDMLSFGIEYNFSTVYGKEINNYDIGNTHLSLLGVKTKYNLADLSFYPYLAFTVGVTTLRSPEITPPNAGGIVIPSSIDRDLGIKPEFGLEIYNVVFSVAYIVPSPFKLTALNLNAGALQLGIGYRGTLELN